jgi:hypothetical protein
MAGVELVVPAVRDAKLEFANKGWLECLKVGAPMYAARSASGIRLAERAAYIDAVCGEPRVAFGEPLL